MARFILRSFILFVVLLIAGVAYAIWPRTADMRGFDADAVARLETGMWRDYYARDHKALATKLYSLYRDHYRFSPSDSVQLAYQAGKAAELFQPTKSRAEAQVALPFLIGHYKVIRDRSGESFDPAKAAELELDWWQLRRENATPEQYGVVVAQVNEELFRVKNEQVTHASIQRAAMMRYRDDRRESGMQPDDWAHIEKNLIESYRELKAGLARIP